MDYKKWTFGLIRFINFTVPFVFYTSTRIIANKIIKKFIHKHVHNIPVKIKVN